MKRILTNFLAAVLLLSMLGTGRALAQLSNGKVYRIVCSGTNSVSLGASALTDVAAVATSETEKAQQWYVTKDGDNYTFRNLANGRYLLGNNSTSSEWKLTKESNDFTVTVVNSNYCIRQVGHDNGHGYMHKDGGNNIVSWNSSAENSQWTPVEVEYSDADLQAVWDAVNALVVPEATVASYNTALESIFADKACTQLNSTYSAKTVDQIKADANYLALPAALQAMVLKVKGGDWSEANAVSGKEGWSHDYAKRFRVQMYEPYSVEGEITSYLRINAHSNMDNPTGIYANGGEPVYIMVDGDIADGAELWVAHQAGLGATQYYNNIAHTQLHEGLNVVPYFKDASVLWIDYVVHTYNADGTTLAQKFPHKISDYSPLKIHIEGGHINGFFNAIGDFRATTDAEDLWGAVDNDEDWNYYKVRAPLNGTDAPNRDFPLLGSRQTLLFPLGQQANEGGDLEEGLLYHLDNITVLSTPNCYGGNGHSFGDYSNTYYSGLGLNASTGKINIMIEAWDRIMYTELATMGLVSRSTMDKMNALYPRWTSEGTPAEIYDYNNASSLDGETYQEFCNGVDYSEYFNHHGAAIGAPSGYMSGGWRNCSYHYNTMGSVIGKIAAEAGPTWGPAHEIGHQHQSVFNLNGQTEVTNNFFSNVAVWYMGMGTSRINGNEGSLESVLAAFNTDGNDLYTNNIWAITHLYYRLWLYYHLAGNNTQFWPRLFELCRQEPIVNGGNISGETSLLRFYKHACNAAGEDLTEFFRAHGFFEVMDNRLVGDYSNATYNVTQAQIDAAIADIKGKGYPVNYAALFINDATGDTTPKHDGKTKRALWDASATAETGSVNDFINEPASISEYEATVTADGNVVMTGGEGAVGFMLLDESGRLLSFGNKSSFALSSEARYLLNEGKATLFAVDAQSNTVKVKMDAVALQKALLEALVAEVEALPVDDGTCTHIGFYTQPFARDLMTALEGVKSIMQAGNGGYGAAYELLHAELEALLAADPDVAKVKFDPALTYTLKNCAYPKRSMVVSNNTVYGNENVDLGSAVARWQFEETATADVYRVKNMSGVYCPKISASGAMTVTDDASKAGEYILEDLGHGLWAISLTPSADNTSFHCASNAGYKVVGWGTGSDATRWYLTAVEANADVQFAAELQALVAKTESLVQTIGFADKIKLQTTDATAPFYLWCNANVTSGGDASMPASGYNILDGNDQTFLHTVYSGNSQDGLHHYLRLDMGEGNSLSKVQFSYKTRHNGNSKSHPKVIKVEGSNDLDVFEEIATISEGLPNDYSAVYTSPELTNGKSYRYIRFMVTDTYGTPTDGNGHKYFYIAEFGIPTLYVKIGTEYEEYVTDDAMVAAYDAVVVAKAALASGEGLAEAMAVMKAAYARLCEEYYGAIDVKKRALKELIDSTVELIAAVGTVELGSAKEVALTSNNFYCNAPYLGSGADNSREYVAKLTDGDSGTYLHTDYNNTSEDGLNHYLRVDLGEGNSAESFRFCYQNRTPSSYKVFPKVLEIQGSMDNVTYESVAVISSGLPENAGETYESQLLGNGKAYRYFRFMVNSTYANRATPNYFCMSEFSFTAVKNVDVVIKANYVGLVSDDMLYSTYLVNESSRIICGADNDVVSVGMIDEQIAELQAAYDALNALVEMLPQTGTFYALRCAYENRYLYVNETDGMQWNAQYDANSSRAVWMFEDAENAIGFKMKSMHTGDYLGAVSNNVKVVLGASAKGVLISPSSSVEGAVVFADANNGLGLHAHGAGNNVIGYTNAASANHYFLEEVAPENIHHDVTMTATYSSVMLNYNAIVPAGVTAYIATGVDGKTVILECVAQAGGVLPANTPVILYRDDEETVKRFVYTDEDATVDTTNSLLYGRLCVDYIACLDGYRYYKLLIKDGEAKMCYMYEEYDASGNFYANTNDGGHIKCSANKVYMVLPEGVASMTTFDVNVGGATGVDEVKADNGEMEAIYDLTGRKLKGENGKLKGVYIINGKKVLVK